MADAPGYPPIPSPTVSMTMQVQQGSADPVVTMAWYNWLLGLEARVQLAFGGEVPSITEDLETLRVALNEVRANPATVYPDVPPFA